MNLIPKIRQGEELDIDKLNAVIDKLNGIEVSKRELETLKAEIRSDLEKNNAILEGIKNSQSSVQQIAQSDSLETITNLINMVIAKQVSCSNSSKQYFKMEGADNNVTIYLMEENPDGDDIAVTSFTLTQGKDGEQGERGLQGEQGVPGPRGLPGPRGYRGITGETGQGVDIQAAYTEDALSDRVPSDINNYLRLDINTLNSDGSIKSTDTRYILTHGYLYVPSVEYREEDGVRKSYLVFDKTIGGGAGDATHIDRGYDITGAQGPVGPQGKQGIPGTGLTCSNLIRITDFDILSGRHRLPEETDVETLETLLQKATTPDNQDALINSTLSSLYTTKRFGILPLDDTEVSDEDGVRARRFTFVEKVNSSWRLLRGTSFPSQTSTEPNTELHNNDYENSLTQIVNTRQKLIVGASFLHSPETDADFNTILYTVYDRPRLTDSKGTVDLSYYVLVKSLLNGGIVINDSIKEDVYANNIILPTSKAGKGNITANNISVNTISATTIRQNGIPVALANHTHSQIADMSDEISDILDGTTPVAKAEALISPLENVANPNKYISITTPGLYLLILKDTNTTGLITFTSLICVYDLNEDTSGTLTGVVYGQTGGGVSEIGAIELWYSSNTKRIYVDNGVDNAVLITKLIKLAEV